MTTIFILSTHDDDIHGAFNPSFIFYTYEAMDSYMKQVEDPTKFRLEKYTVHESGKLTDNCIVDEYYNAYQQQREQERKAIQASELPAVEKTYKYMYNKQ